jgi:hypothetical protein
MEDRRALPLLLASDRFASGDAGEPLDRLRMQKGVFLLQMRGPPRWQQTFAFVPWDWGPYSRELVRTVGELQQADLLEARAVEFREYPSYRTTAQGEEALAAVEISREERAFLRQVRHYVTSRAFKQLLREVYAEYPEYARNSRFRA